MVYLLFERELVGESIAHILRPYWKAKTFYLWKSLKRGIEEQVPSICILHYSDALSNSSDFLEFLISTPIEKRPKILLISEEKASYLFSYCDTYGINGVIDFNCKNVSLVQIVRALLNNDIVRSCSEIKTCLAHPFDLTNEEWEVAKLLVSDKSKKEIIELLEIGERTFERKRKSLYSKCKVTSPLALYKKLVIIGAI